MDSELAPKCPHCEVQPLVFGEDTITTAQGTVVSVIWCNECKVVLNIATIGKQPVLARDPTRKDGGLIKLS